MRIPVHLITGATSAGKTTAILRMLAARPSPEHWAVLVNDFGEVTLSAAPGVSEQMVTVREVAGCICCTAQVPLRTAIVALLRAARPQRLLIEASSAAHPSAIAKLLREPGLASTVHLARTVCVIDPRHALDPRYAASDVYRAQAQAADIVLMSKADVTSTDECDAARAVLEKLGSATIVEAIELTHLL